MRLLEVAVVIIIVMPEEVKTLEKQIVFENVVVEHARDVSNLRL